MMLKRRLRYSLQFAFLTALFLLLLTPEWPAFGDEEYRVDALVGLRQFDFVVWEANAIATKVQAVLANEQAYLTEAQQKAFVFDYMAQLAHVQQLERDLANLFTNPDVPDREEQASTLQTELETARAEMRTRQPLTEAIVQDQVAWALRQAGFDVLEQAWPPVLMHMTPLPTLLVISPRDHIESVHQVPLVTGLSALEMDELETAVFSQLDLSAIVVPLGGLGTYPSMIMETSNLPWFIEVVSHEWTHHWLTLHPVGLRYGQDPQMRIINETIASMVDAEIRDRVLERFYPELLPSETAVSSQSETSPDPNQPLPFDFRAEMAETRIQADAMLAAGNIAGAEAYMEARRRVFVENGYNLRKLNQAYFAFHGAYAAEPGATGSDPIGPMLRDIRANSASLHAFMERVAPIKSYGDLEQIFGEMMAANEG
ncbi:MAG: hypothetical protein KC415_03175 [Anaerolineales bacterium]|nr:hypothetical protein [Anaerolineales bacterium]MCB8990795.1 hypothetical protein [Ardenticatenaceae bacterium]